MKYSVSVFASYVKVIEVEAESKEEALLIAENSVIDGTLLMSKENIDDVMAIVEGEIFDDCITPTT